MANHQRLCDLESQLNWCQHWYFLRVWQDCGSFNSANDFDRHQIAEQVLVEAKGRSKEWAAEGLIAYLNHLTSKLDDLDPEIRQDAAIALGDDCPKDHPAVDVLMERLQSLDQTLHDRACSAWALGRIRARASEAVPILLAVIDETKDQEEAYEFRRFAANAIENLIGDFERV